MIALICLLLTLLASPFKSKSRLKGPHTSAHAAAAILVFSVLPVSPSWHSSPSARRFLFAMQLLDRCIEGIEIRMQDGGFCVHPDGPPCGPHMARGFGLAAINQTPAVTAIIAIAARMMILASRVTLAK
jgi:hypothetical protein